MPHLSNGGHIDRALTNFSVAYQQNATNFIADKIFPIIKVTKQSDVYFEYSKADSFRDEVKQRAQGSESAGFDFNITERDPYFCKKYALHYDITQEERVNFDAPLDLDRDTVTLLTNKMLLNREINFKNKFFKTATWGKDITGVASAPGVNQVQKWSSPTSSPVADINAQMLAMAQATGEKPNFAIMSPDVLYALKQHEEIMDRIKYTQRGVITLELIAQLFELEAIYIPWGVVNVGPVGKDFDDAQSGESTGFIYSGSMLLGHRTKTPSLKAPSAGYIFAWTGLEGASAYGSRIVRLPMDHLGLGTERIEAEMAYDQKLICKDMGTFFTNLV